MVTTRTIGPLHFEDLDPKRFEDLVRQLAYQFKPWRRLEATGRSGSDDGFDARGYEIFSKDDQPSAKTDDEEPVEEQAALSEGTDDRLWLIQCKRERNIGPKALVNYLDDIVLGAEEKLYGLVFTAACDFSKKARDDFAQKCRDINISDWHLWGKAELEDRLFRPENDHLLFAYFGISLIIRRRTQRTELRARLAMKRKADRILKSQSHTHLLLRSPDSSNYPYIDNLSDFRNRPEWVVRQYRDMSHDGLKFCVKRHFAFLSDDGQSWDAAMAWNDAEGNAYNDPWLGREKQHGIRQEIYEFWNKMPEKNKAWFEVISIISFEKILDIDDLGDEYFQSPHIYTPFAKGNLGPFSRSFAEVETTGQWEKRSYYPENENDGRVAHFPANFREPQACGE